MIELFQLYINNYPINHVTNLEDALICLTILEKYGQVEIWNLITDLPYYME